MKPSRLVFGCLLLAAKLPLFADTYNVQITSWDPQVSPYSISLFDDNGLQVVSGNMSGPNELYDGEGNPTGVYALDVLFNSVAPGTYSVHFNGYDATTGTNLALWTTLQSVPSSMSFGDFLYQQAPLGPDTGDEIVDRNLDVLGNLMNFGSTASSDPGMRLRFNSSTNHLDTLLPRERDVDGNEYARMSWSFPQNGYVAPVMNLDASGTLTLYSQLAQPRILLNGSPVLTTSSMESGSISSLRMAGSSYASYGSIGAGAATNASGYYSFASGYLSTSSGYYSIAGGFGTVANTLGMVALGRYNLSSGSASSAYTWNATDDLFVIGNGASPTARSNALTIKKSGDTQIGGSVTVGTGGSASILLAPGSGTRQIGVGSNATGTSLTIGAGSATAVGEWGGNLFLSSGGVNPAGSAYQGSRILFQTAHRTIAGGVPQTQMTLHEGGGLGIGTDSFYGNYWGGGCGLDVAWGGIPGTLVLGAEVNLKTRTSGQPKWGSIVFPPVSASDRPVFGMGLHTHSAGSNLYIGGGGWTNYAATDVEIWTGPTITSEPGTKRFSVNRIGAIAAGEGSVASSPSQFVVGKNNDLRTNNAGTNHTQGLFIVGAGATDAAADRKNALRISSTGAVLVQPSGDIDMGDFKAGEQP